MKHDEEKLVVESEQALLDHQWDIALKNSQKALESLKHWLQTGSAGGRIAGNHRDDRVSMKEQALQLSDRACAVYLQAIYETNQFTGGLSYLVATFGSLDDVPPTSMLLWISLALDHPGTRPEAELTLLRILQANTKKSSTWPRRHVLTLLSMYILECLLQELQDASQVSLWLQRQNFVALDPREVAYLQREVEKYISESHVYGSKQLSDSELSFNKGGDQQRNVVSCNGFDSVGGIAIEDDALRWMLLEEEQTKEKERLAREKSLSNYCVRYPGQNTFVSKNESNESPKRTSDDWFHGVKISSTRSLGGVAGPSNFVPNSPYFSPERTLSSETSFPKFSGTTGFHSNSVFERSFGTAVMKGNDDNKGIVQDFNQNVDERLANTQERLKEKTYDNAASSSKTKEEMNINEIDLGWVGKGQYFVFLTSRNLFRKFFRSVERIASTQAISRLISGDSGQIDKLTLVSNQIQSKDEQQYNALQNERSRTKDQGEHSDQIEKGSAGPLNEGAASFTTVALLSVAFIVYLKRRTINHAFKRIRKDIKVGFSDLAAMGLMSRANPFATDIH